MSKKKLKIKSKSDLIKNILAQISGELESGIEPVPEYGIVGEGYTMCYDPVDRSFKRIACGTKIYIIYENYDTKGRTLVYTTYGELVCVEPEKLFYIGYD